MSKQTKILLNHIITQKRWREEKIIRISKSEMKRDDEALKVMATDLVNLGKNLLSQIPIDRDLCTAIDLAKKIKKEGYRRQLQLIGKMLRCRDIELLKASLRGIKNINNQYAFLLKKVDILCQRLVEEGDGAILPILHLYPEVDRQKLRSLIRNAQKEATTNKPSSKAYQQISRYLFNLTIIAQQLPVPHL